MLIALTLRVLGVNDRPILLFDTFAGMTEPSKADIDHHGARAADLLAAAATSRAEAPIWAVAERAEVEANLAATGYPMARVRLIEGDVRITLPRTQTGPIALLRLDTDFEDSTSGRARGALSAASPARRADH